MKYLVVLDGGHSEPEGYEPAPDTGPSVHGPFSDVREAAAFLAGLGASLVASIEPVLALPLPASSYDPDGIGSGPLAPHASPSDVTVRYWVLDDADHDLVAVTGDGSWHRPL